MLQLSTTLCSLWRAVLCAAEWTRIAARCEGVLAYLATPANRSPQEDKDTVWGFLHVLGTTRPGKDNKREWAAIRAVVPKAILTQDPTTALKMLAVQLAKTTPGAANKGEWKAIRAAAASIST